MPLPPRRPAVCVLALFAATGCAPPPVARPEMPPAPVTVTQAARKTVPIQVRGIGTVKAIATVSVRPKVGGELTEVLFEEGDDVQKGQRLFTIDPRPYETAVARAEATLAKDKAALLGAELNLRRLERLSANVSGAELDAARTAVATNSALVAADEAAVKSAKIQLGYTAIHSPIGGRTGAVLVTPGNLVEANDINPLVVINQLSPIDVTFSVPEKDLPAVAAARRDGPLAATAVVRPGDPPIPGRLAFIDNAVDPTTGTVVLKAEFANADRRLWPGLFVDVVLTLGDRPDSVTVPAAAVQTGQKGDYVYVVGRENKAFLKPVTVAFEAAGEAVVADGLAGGETVVVEGQLRLAPGVKTDPRPLAAPPRPAAPASADPAAVAGGGS